MRHHADAPLQGEHENESAWSEPLRRYGAELRTRLAAAAAGFVAMHTHATRPPDGEGAALAPHAETSSTNQTAPPRPALFPAWRTALAA